MTINANTTEPRRRKLLPEMEGSSARRYAKLRGTDAQLQTSRREAARLAASLADGAAVLEVAHGPGYFAVELAKLGRFDITALDVSRTFVLLAAELAARTGVTVDFQLGDVAVGGAVETSKVPGPVASVAITRNCGRRWIRTCHIRARPSQFRRMSGRRGRGRPSFSHAGTVLGLSRWRPLWRRVGVS
jgi:SAM-dependent methyltransferase